MITPDQPGSTPQSAVTGHATITANRVEGTTVYNKQGEKIGKVEDLMIDKASGQVRCVTASFGAFMGLGGDLYPIPWSMLDYDTEVGGYVIDEVRLKDAPSLKLDQRSQDDLLWRDEVFKYWMAQPYWPA
ncbi:PRC-barrel domain-containing protein [Phenylobacterium immobile]|uniref:PRC-barrel domain-containing protein n=1 Tax=Phenylobacterium immobile TaxID=21 RepID=UPI000B0585DB|nr:PRC-barrel domain-containing protein [Phenylobacterium immobile]